MCVPAFLLDFLGLIDVGFVISMSVNDFLN